jgi:hypothetical protein
MEGRGIYSKIEAVKVEENGRGDKGSWLPLM